MSGVFFQGLGISAGLIMAIGAQNAYVLSLGIRKNYHKTAALICAICDAVLISLGIAGVGTVVASDPMLTFYAGWGGAMFLFWYATKSLISALKKESMDTVNSGNQSLKAIITTTAAFTLLNPHVYLDTLVLLGSIGGQYPAEDRTLFALGACTASFIWFFTLSIGAGFLAPVFRNPKAWKVLDLVVCLIMCVIAFQIIPE
ncbi:MAG: amino acid transporter [Proteobacteria bacterium]|nr:amino acid transporter [Pseudomonadota bacterium]